MGARGPSRKHHATCMAFVARRCLGRQIRGWQITKVRPGFAPAAGRTVSDLFGLPLGVGRMMKPATEEGKYRGRPPEDTACFGDIPCADTAASGLPEEGSKGAEGGMRLEMIHMEKHFPFRRIRVTCMRRVPTDIAPPLAIAILDKPFHDI